MWTKGCLQKSVQQPVCSKTHLCCLFGRLDHRWTKWGASKISCQVGLGKPSKGQGVCADWCVSGSNAWTRDGPSKSHSGCSLKRYKKPWNLARTGRAGDFQWNCRWCGHRARKRQAVQSHAQTILLSAPCLYCSSCAKLKKCRGLQSRKGKLWVIILPVAQQRVFVPSMRPSHQHRREHLGRGACFQQSLRALWLLQEFPEGSLMALLSAGTLDFAALCWELHSSYPPWDCLSWGDPCACCWPPKEPPQLTMGSIGRALWNVPPVDAAWLKCEWYKCKFCKCIILYDEVWQRMCGSLLLLATSFSCESLGECFHT